ncbi:hypothetical protein Peur_025806 [Populus x canadensis]
MATIGETSMNPPQSKPVVVRVKRKAHQSRLDAFWLEINEKPTKKAMLDLEKLSISNNSVDVQGNIFSFFLFVIINWIWRSSKFNSFS